ncbi:MULTISPECIES: hypothetical protein [unclassified Streptomyces]|uniref:hypothetical protein n=1 Tax=unclassified Streptomyces TaxID=2593676 RepID=UPI00343AF96A
MTETPTRQALVPHIATWTEEQRPEATLIMSGWGIAYANELPHDRDEDGALWIRRQLRQGRGEPEYGNVHAERQRRVMSSLLCQVCAGPADRDERGVLWLLEDNRGDWAGWPNDLLTTHPPVCLPCAREAVRHCPHLLGGHVAVRVKQSDIFGVYGTRYQPGRLRPVAGSPVVVPYGDPAIRWVLAGQQVRGLNSCTIVDLRAEVTGHP